jgi:peptidyl-prolyl cis-trans isomerase SurA
MMRLSFLVIAGLALLPAAAAAAQTTATETTATQTTATQTTATQSGTPQTGAPIANPFAAALYVNGRAITNYEVAQRERFLAALEGPGDHHDEAVKALIDDKLRLFEAAKYDIKPTDAEVKAGMDEFASRAKLTSDQFLAELEKAGVDPQTFRDFVKAGQAWRAVVQGTIAPTVTVTDADVKDSRALSLAHGVPRLLLSELIMPATPQYAPQTVPLAEQLSATLHGDAAFSAAAKKYSASDTASKGGKLDWISASQLPQPVVQAVTGLAPGQVSKPVALPNAIGIFEMRGLSDAPAPPPGRIEVDYAEYLLPGIRTPDVAAAAARLRARAETCNDLYKLAKGQPADVLTRVTQALPKVPADVALELAKLDPGESSTNLTRGNNTVFLMLCARTVTETPPQTPEEMKNALFAAKVNALADQKLDELRAAAIIRKP